MFTKLNEGHQHTTPTARLPAKDEQHANLACPRESPPLVMPGMSARAIDSEQRAASIFHPRTVRLGGPELNIGNRQNAPLVRRRRVCSLRAATVAQWGCGDVESTNPGRHLVTQAGFGASKDGQGSYCADGQCNVR